MHIKDGTRQAHIITDDTTFAAQHDMKEEYQERWYTTVPVEQLTELTYTVKKVPE
ncbi:hypothetical protein GCM10008955_42080 [Deinococcus malanensis]|uniref:Uncharacterized protein n=1 Tax=Deinococcus malanensis TaxID=1706855 RepID=A0ABQ2F2U8_9DEIO|nr:hypothetical protein GCM10008955_42080 [Deinococcus malanensis]